MHQHINLLNQFLKLLHFFFVFFSREEPFSNCFRIHVWMPIPVPWRLLVRNLSDLAWLRILLFLRLWELQVTDQYFCILLRSVFINSFGKPFEGKLIFRVHDRWRSAELDKFLWLIQRSYVILPIKISVCRAKPVFKHWVNFLFVFIWIIRNRAV